MSEITASERTARAGIRLVFGFGSVVFSAVMAGLEFHSLGISVTVFFGLLSIWFGFFALSAAFETG